MVVVMWVGRLICVWVFEESVVMLDLGLCGFRVGGGLDFLFYFYGVDFGVVVIGYDLCYLEVQVSIEVLGVLVGVECDVFD